MLPLVFLPFKGICQSTQQQQPPVIYDGSQSLRELGGDLRAMAQGKKVLVAYYSRTGYTEQVAKWIHDQAGGDLVRLETAQPYPGNYQAMVGKNVEEQRSGAKPPLKTKVANLASYDIVFLGFPIWAMALPRPLATFLSSYDFSGKTIVPFCTNGGYGPGSSRETIVELCPGSTVRDVLSFKGNMQKQDTK
jgi:Flavodoxins